MTRIVLAVGLTIGGLAAWAAKTLVETIVRQEYPNWGPRVAIFLVGLACRLWPRRGEEWRAEIAAIQESEQESGVAFALSIVLAGLRHVMAARPLRRQEPARQHLTHLGRLTRRSLALVTATATGVATLAGAAGVAAATGPSSRGGPGWPPWLVVLGCVGIACPALVTWMASRRNLRARRHEGTHHAK